ncbi:YopX family protein [Campylobacter upsaliensis]|uniref:YopX protein n=1 Tax=Campylobacter upsaliensis TaxID=28080 RepID=A0A381F3X7_CAMUP|nr:YopX family protein [Campylobacter upsaliensis]EAL52583.1 hypothetical protein CUPA0131 [Campylobacter upsaliensis RM3195]MCR2108985.1 YopX family protein [Campylobacter upsaliensis]MCR2109998.1 YopX family protein [Campylobacter upsaliensis]MCR2113738.1 YopX family protein [Campylobacter upsaliensis]MCR2115735.1 YopX family protein [Campylobacter upsaliensis]
MKLKDFDFRLIMSEAFLENEVKCQNEECPCADFKIFYDKEAVLSFSDIAFSDLEAQIDLFTGYKDKKGQKIYENDIVLMTLNDYEKEKDTIYKKIDSVYYTKGKGFILSNVFDNKINLDDDFCENCCEVIGNIHEDKDLLAYLIKQEKAYAKEYSNNPHLYPDNLFDKKQEELCIRFEKELEALLQKRSNNETSRL